LQAHAPAQPVNEHPSDNFPFGGNRCLFFNDRGKGDGLVKICKRQIGGTTTPKPAAVLVI